jgi:hypothetical protein
MVPGDCKLQACDAPRGSGGSTTLSVTDEAKGTAVMCSPYPQLSGQYVHLYTQYPNLHPGIVSRSPSGVGPFPTSGFIPTTMIDKFAS